MESGIDAAPAARELYRSQTLVVREIACSDRNRWIVTFDNYGIGHGFDRPGFGESWLQSVGLSAIHVMGRAEDWYQYEDIHAALAVVRMNVSGAARVITYGSSMGGYAAVRFADAVGAHAALALSPQYTLAPATAAHDVRWSQDADRIHWLEELNGPLSSETNVVLVYDPVGPDGWHGRRIVEETNARPIPLPHTAHPVTSFLSEIGLLGELVLRTLDDTIDVRTFRREARARRASSSVYLGELALRMPSRRRKAAVAMARRAVGANAAGMHSRISLARLLGQSGQHEDALEHLQFLVQSSDRAIIYLVELGDGLMRAGRSDEAKAIVDEVLRRMPGAAHLYSWAANIAWAARDGDQARSYIASAIRLDPAHHAYPMLAAHFDIPKPPPRSVWAKASRWLGIRRPRWTSKLPQEER